MRDEKRNYHVTLILIIRNNNDKIRLSATELVSQPAGAGAVAALAACLPTQSRPPSQSRTLGLSALNPQQPAPHSPIKHSGVHHGEKSGRSQQPGQGADFLSSYIRMKILDN